MGTVFKKTVTKAMPANAERFTKKGQRWVRWLDAKGKTRTAAVTIGNDGSERLSFESRTYYAKYRDGAGIVRVVATGCKDETAARSVLADLEREAELVKAGVMTGAEVGVGRHREQPLANHIAAYVDHLRAKGTTSGHRDNTRRFLVRIALDCSFRLLADLNREGLERWMTNQAKANMSARTRNAYRNAAVAFGHWLVESGRDLRNPFAKAPRADERSDPRRQRRAMTEAELVQVLDVARRRPLVEATTIRTGQRKGETLANVRAEVRIRLDRLGRERALLYKTLVLTGLRKNELASLTVGKLDLDGPIPFAILDAADEKNRQGSEIALRDDLAADLRSWLDDKLGELQDEARRQGKPIPVRLPSDTPVFNVPAGLLRILDRDLKAAGIPKRDERGRTLDVHALRTTFGTLLSKGGVAPRTAQAAMRHSDIRLTMQTYTDPKLLDVRGALDSLPSLPLPGEHSTTPDVARATGTEDLRQIPFAPRFAPTPDKPRKFESFVDKGPVASTVGTGKGEVDVTSNAVNRKGSLTVAVNEPQSRGERIRTSDLLNPIQAR